MAIIVVDTNSNFKPIESNTFGTEMAYYNGGAIAICWRILKRDVQSI